MIRSALIVLALLPSLACAAVINVPADQPTIQAGIDAAAMGDEVVIAPGTYFERIDLLGKAITVRGTDPNDPGVVGATVLDAGQAGTAILCVSGESSAAVLSGFTVIRGLGLGEEPGGLLIEGADPTIHSMVFAFNTSLYSAGERGRGGAVAVRGGAPTFDSCVFLNNGTVGDGGRSGGAVFLDDGAGLISFTDCLFQGNRATDGGAIYGGRAPLLLLRCTFDSNQTRGFGGAVSVIGDADIEACDCVFRNNRADTPTQGGGALQLNTTGAAVFESCEFIRNESVNTLPSDSLEKGAAVWCTGGAPEFRLCRFIGNIGRSTAEFAAADASFDGCEFIGNNAPQSTAFQHVIVTFQQEFLDPNRVVRITSTLFSDHDSTLLYVGPRYNVEFVNCTLVSNASGLVRVEEHSSAFPANTATIVNSILVANSETPFIELGQSNWISVSQSILDFEWGGPGNFIEDPQFIDSVSGDYRLSPTSSAVNSGLNGALPPGSTADADGNPRVVGGAVDLGAYEFQGATLCVGDCDDSGVVDFNDLVSMLFEFGNSGDARCDADESGTVDFNDLVAALFLFGPCP